MFDAASTFVIVPAAPEDVPLILALITELAEYEKLAHEVEATEPLLREALFSVAPVVHAVIARTEQGIPAGFALFFSTFSTPILSAALTFSLFIVGHFSADLLNFQDVVESPAAGRLAAALYWVLPNLAQFDVKAQVVHGQAVSAGYVALAVAYAAAYIALLLTISVLVFSRRDFK